MHDLPPELVALTVAALHGLMSGDKMPGHTGPQDAQVCGAAAAQIGISAYEKLQTFYGKSMQAKAPE